METTAEPRKEIIMSFADIIKDLVLFQNLSKSEMSMFLLNCSVAEFPIGETIFSEGEKSTSMTIILKGEVKIFSNGLEICTVPSPALLGEIGLFTDTPRNATIKSVEDLFCLKITREVLYSLFQKAPQLGYKIHRNIILCLGNKVNYCNQQIRSLYDELFRKGQENSRLKGFLKTQTFHEKGPLEVQSLSTMDQHFSIPAPGVLSANRPSQKSRKYMRVFPSSNSCYVTMKDKKIDVKDLSQGGICMNLENQPVELAEIFKKGYILGGELFLKNHPSYTFSGTVKNLFSGSCGVEFNEIPQPLGIAIKNTVKTLQKVSGVV